MLRYLFALVVLTTLAQARDEDGVWVVVKNSAGVNLSAVVLAGYGFGDLRPGEYSNFEKVEGVFQNTEVKAVEGQTSLSGKATADAAPLVPGYHLFDLHFEQGRLEVTSSHFNSYSGITNRAGGIEKRAPRADEISVEGGVRRAGFYPHDGLKALTLAEALEFAGGMWLGDYTTTPVAGTWGIMLHREVEGERQTYKLNMRQLRGERAKDGDFVVQPGDVIVVPICL